MKYTDVMTTHELRVAHSYLVYKRMKRRNAPDDEQTMREIKQAIDERSERNEPVEDELINGA